MLGLIPVLFAFKQKSHSLSLRMTENVLSDLNELSLTIEAKRDMHTVDVWFDVVEE